MSKILCPQCNKFLANDINNLLEIDFSSNLSAYVAATSHAPSIAIEIKCDRCKTYCIGHGGEYRHVNKNSTGMEITEG